MDDDVELEGYEVGQIRQRFEREYELEQLNESRKYSHPSAMVVDGKKEIAAPKLSVVLTTFNRHQLLEKVLVGFANQTANKEDYEVIVIDDGSKPSAQEVVHRFLKKMNVVYFHQDNSGPGVARNNGIKIAKGPIILLSDDDDLPGPKLITEHLRIHQEYPDERIAVLGRLDWHKDLKVSPLMHYITHVGGEYFGFDNLQDGQFYDVWKFWSGLISAKRSLLTSLKGPFDSRLHWGYEDIELACRLLPKEVKIFYNAKAERFVLVPVDFEGFCKRRYRQGRALYRVACKHPELIISRYHLQNATELYRSKFELFLDDWSAKVMKFESLLEQREYSDRLDTAKYMKSLYAVYAQCLLGYWLKGYVEEMAAVEKGDKSLDKPVNVQANSRLQQELGYKKRSCSKSTGHPHSFSQTVIGDRAVDFPVCLGDEQANWNQPVMPSGIRPLRITFVNSHMPGFDMGGSNLRIYHILKILTAWGHEIDHLYMLQYNDDGKYKAAFDNAITFIKTRDSLINFKDYLHFNKVSDIDCVWITNLWATDYLEYALELTRWLKKHMPTTRIIVDTMDLHYKKYIRKFKVSGDKEDLVEAEKFLELEKALYPLADVVLVVTEDEEKGVLTYVGQECNVVVVPNIHRVSGSTIGLQRKKHICFLGSFRVRDNFNAAQWFQSKVFPLIREKAPEVEFRILGYGNEELIEEFGPGPNVKVVGYVEDAERAVAEHRLFVCPMRYGAGMKGKLAVAALSGTPIVSTTVGVEGFGFTDGRECFIADKPAEFAQKCLRLLEEDDLWRQFSERAKNHVAGKVNIRTVSKKIWSIMEAITDDRQVNDRPKDSLPVYVPEIVAREAIEDPKVTIITTCHNSEKFLPECLRSIKNQTMQQWELILLDDSSTDGTRQMIERYSQSDGRIRPYYFDTTDGPYKRRNFAIRRARTDFIVVHDADDIMSPSKLQIFYNEMVADRKLGAVGSFYRCFIEEFKGLQYTDCHHLPTEHDVILEKFCSWRHGMSHGAAMIRKELFDAVGLYDENPFASDAFWFAKIGEYMKHCPGIRFKNIPAYLTLIRIHAKGQTGILPCFDPRNRRMRYHQYCECKLRKIRQKLSDFPDTDIKKELQNCVCSDFLERFRNHIVRWESKPLGGEVVAELLKNSIWLFNRGFYVKCVSMLNGIEVMLPDIALQFKNYNLLRGIAFFALELKQQSLDYLKTEMENHNSYVARQFISDYFEKKLTMDVQNWCAERVALCNLQMVDAKHGLAEYSEAYAGAAEN